MATMKLLVLFLACLCGSAFSSPTDLVYRNSTLVRNTIFADERLQGEIFENIDAFRELNLASRNTQVDYRLPTTTRPIHYSVLWIIDFSRSEPTQSGTVSIQLAATQQNVNEIVIHADDLVLENVQLALGTTNIPITHILEKERQFLIVRLNTGTLNFNQASPVVYTLTVSFGAPLRTDMYGIYRSWFKNSPTVAASWMASTQFQATSARYAFPCYDEPSFKATFDVTIRRPTAYRSWFCTRLRETTNTVANYQDDIYHTTPVMSTYLLALIVAQYDSREVFDQAGLLKFEVIARPGAIQAGQGEYALEVGQKLLAEMSSHTAYDFYDQHPQLKMTQASIPDFGAGAMENWGLLTYREAYLMYDQQQTSSHFKQIIAYILSHEIAHMWFGNLVTCDWWDVLWLNEGFARYYQYFLTYWVEDMGFSTRFVPEQVHTALLADSADIHPLTNPGVGSPASVSAMFSTISYNKGAAIIRMTEHLLGTDVHRQGLRDYLRGKHFQTAVPLDLFTYLERAGNNANALNYGNDFNFVDYYRSWTEQAGHPVLNVHVNHRTGEMTIYQRRFFISPGANDVNTNYIIPITFTTGSNPNFENTKPTHVISKAVSVINRGTIGDHWVLFNIQQTGFYRVNYDDYTWNLIIIALRGADRTRINQLNKAQIVNDVFQFARSGLMSYNRAFNILSFLENETEYAPWVAAMTGFTWLRNRLAGTPQLTQLNNLIVRWATTVMGTVNYVPAASETFMQSYLRYQLAPIMCALEVPACLESARNQLAALQATQPTEVPADSRNWVYCSGLRQGVAADFNFLWNRFQTHNVYTEKILLLQVLGCTRDATSLNTFMNAIVQTNELIRPQDYTTAFNSAVTGNEENTQIAFQFIQNNLPQVISAFGSAVTPLSYISARLRTAESIAAFEAWATSVQTTLGTASYASVMRGAQLARDSLAWTASVQDDINNYLVNGDQQFGTTEAVTEATTAVTTAQQPGITQPATPDLPSPDVTTPAPGSAVTTFVSITAMFCAMVAPYIL
ncbi:membrane alanyl aminopeptidase-like [Anticarsia gemmatalis]|uniref:membrane alanyl aminopeptidase-like n=1 Tax=Anticarsia gemmatalis TaxID=129554 RepID=UPI003F767828